MQIIIHDTKTGKKFMIKGHGLDWEIFKESKGKNVDGVKKGAGEWTSCRCYPTDLEYAVGKAMRWILADPEDEEQHVVEADKAVKELKKIFSKRIKDIVAEVCNG